MGRSRFWGQNERKHAKTHQKAPKWSKSTPKTVKMVPLPLAAVEQRRSDRANSFANELPCSSFTKSDLDEIWSERGRRLRHNSGSVSTAAAPRPPLRRTRNFDSGGSPAVGFAGVAESWGHPVFPKNPVARRFIGPSCRRKVSTAGRRGSTWFPLKIDAK